MSVNKRKPKVSDEQASKLVAELADKPYDKPKPVTPIKGRSHELDESEPAITTSFSLPQSLLHKLEDKANANKRAALKNRTVSSIIRAALKEYLD